jgi:two-component system, chemotaxis family, protein-glutamate methylesterase/glutaminase
MIRVVVVEDSLLERARLVAALEGEGDIEVVGQAGTAAEAEALTERMRPDLVTVDLVLPGKGGISAIEGIMASRPTPILVLSGHITSAASAAAVEALLAGAVEALPKPRPWDGHADKMLRDRVRLLRGVTVVAHPRGRRPARDAAGPPRAVVAIAASTGGPAALAEILPALDGLHAPVLIVQHLHPQLVDGFVSWMARISALPVATAADGIAPRPATVYIGPTGLHLRLAPDRRLAVGPDPPALHRPSADELFASLAANARETAVGVLLTGMGEDGAAGLKAVREQGGTTIVQDAASSVVDGMPAAARRAGAAAQVRPLAEIPQAIKAAVGRIAP